MRYLLMNKDIEVLSFEYDSNEVTHCNSITNFFDISSIQELNLDAGPFCLLVSKREELPKVLQDWFLFRLNRKLKLCANWQTALDNHAVSLSDTYWVKAVVSSLCWDDVSPFTNDFTINGCNPDYCTNGNQEKFWIIQGRERVLVKKNTKWPRQEPDNEVIASKIMDVLEIPHVVYQANYTVPKHSYSICTCFTSSQVEYVPACFVHHEKYAMPAIYERFLHTIDQLHIPVSESELMNMVLVDSMINNEDRHWGNFGFLRNVDTGEFLGLAPLFDHGNSLWYRKKTNDIATAESFPHMPFTTGFHYDFHWVKKVSVNLSPITRDKIADIVYESHMDEARKQVLCKTIWRNVEKLFDCMY